MMSESAVRAIRCGCLLHWMEMENGKWKNVGVALVAVCLIGCAKTRPEGHAGGPAGTNTQGQVSRFASQWRGRVDSVSAKGRFVVISFPIGALPSANTRLGIYR